MSILLREGDDMEFEINVEEECGFEMELGDEYGLEFAWQATNTVIITPCMGLETIRSALCSVA